MNRKKATAAAALLVTGASIALAGCSSGGSPGADGTAEADVTLKLWSWRTEDVDTYNDKIFPAFEKANPGIDVEFEAPVVNTEYNQSLTTALAGSDGPDLAMVRAYGGLQGWTQDLMPLDDVVPGLSDIDPAVLQGSKGVDGKIYSVPTVTQTLQMFYNKDIFEQHGLDVPTTWDDFIKLNDTLLGKDVVPMALGAKDGWVLPIFSDIVGAARYGATEFEKKVVDGSTTFSDPDYVAALQTVKDLQKYLNEGDDVTGVAYTDAQTEFSSGLAAMYPGGTFELTTFRTQNPDLNIGTFPVPPPPGSVASSPVVPAYADGGWAINAKIDPAKKDAAEKLVKWMDTKEFGQLVADNLFMFSAVPGVTYSDPVLKQMWSDYQASPAAYLMLVNYRYCNPTADSILATDTQKMFLGQMSAKQVGDDVASGVSTCTLPKF
jgi:raffinose/stachyose/melibiose transport system substrate-binding protein